MTNFFLLFADLYTKHKTTSEFFMKKLILIILALSSSLFASIAEVTAINGKAVILRADEQIPVTMHSKIEKLDTIKTKKDTKLQIVFNDNTIISLGQKSTFKIEEYLFGKKKVKARFNVKGLFKSITGKIGHISPNNFKLKTQNATIGVRGTTIIGESTKDIDKIICSSGQIVVRTPLGETIVNKGQQTIVRFGSRPSIPTVVKNSVIQKKEQSISPVPKKSFVNVDKIERLSKTMEKASTKQKVADVKEQNKNWGNWDKVDAIKKELQKEKEEEPRKQKPSKEKSADKKEPTKPKIDEDLPYLLKLRELAGVKKATYSGEVSGFVDSPANRIKDGKINLNVDLSRGKVDGDIGFLANQKRWEADIKDGKIDKNGALEFGISNNKNLNGSGDGMLRGEHLQHANGTFTINDKSSNQNAYGSFKAGRK
ncbi:MAG: hypothetical protein DSZ06_01445 [Sulfurospirillum sp.]|nr:MAG: hypothetical protein DSZ06_01445 [Sulfurospirillum sp.]